MPDIGIQFRELGRELADTLDDLSGLDDRVDRLEDRADTLEGEATEAEDRLDKVEATLEGVETSIDAIEGRLESVESSIPSEADMDARVEAGIADLDDRIDRLKACTKDFAKAAEEVDREQDRQIEDLQQEKDALTRMVCDLQSRVASLEERLEAMLAGPELDILVKRRNDRDWQAFGLAFATRIAARNGTDTH